MKGSSLEKTILASQRGVVDLVQIHQAAKRIGGGKVIALRGPVDFAGTVGGTGRAVFIDAKESDEPNRFKADNTHLHIHQRDGLIRMGEAGALAGCICESTHHRRFYWLPWWMLKNGDVSYLWESLIPIGPSTHLIDFARLLRAHETAGSAVGVKP